MAASPLAGDDLFVHPVAAVSEVLPGVPPFEMLFPNTEARPEALASEAREFDSTATRF